MSTVITIACQWKNLDSESLLFQEDLFRYTTRKNQERKEVMIYRKDGYFNNSPMKFYYMLPFFFDVSQRSFGVRLQHSFP